jgi:hypothetical protein
MLRQQFFELRHQLAFEPQFITHVFRKPTFDMATNTEVLSANVD